MKSRCTCKRADAGHLTSCDSYRPFGGVWEVGPGTCFSTQLIINVECKPTYGRSPAQTAMPDREGLREMAEKVDIEPVEPAFSVNDMITSYWPFISLEEKIDLILRDPHLAYIYVTLCKHFSDHREWDETDDESEFQ